MPHRVIDALAPVRRRQRYHAALRGFFLGVVFGSLAAILLEALRRPLGFWYSPWPAISMLLVGPTLGALIGVGLRRTWLTAAAAVDSRCHLKDRASSSLEFIAAMEPSPVRELAVQDAVTHLQRVDPTKVVPLGLPRGWGRGATFLAVALVLTLWPSAQPEGQAAPSRPIVPIVAQAEELKEEFKKLEELAKEDKDLEKLNEELNKLAEEMKQPGVDIKEALAKLSEMQAAIQQQQAQLSVAAMDQQLAALAEAMTAVGGLQEAGAALSKGDLQKSAELLEKLEAPPLEPTQREQAQQKLKELAKAMENAGMGQLANATSELADSVGGAGGKGGQGLAGQIRKHAQRKNIDQWMQQQLARLSECKGEASECNKKGLCKSCNGAGCKPCNGTGLNGGTGTARSNNPSQKWGTGASGNPGGEATKLDANRQQVNITGQQGDGPTDVETTTTPEAKQLAGRSYKEAYNEYRKLSDAVLENEPIPLGHRQTIRKYFEAIRPDSQ